MKYNLFDSGPENPDGPEVDGVIKEERGGIGADSAGAPSLSDLNTANAVDSFALYGMETDIRT